MWRSQATVVAIHPGALPCAPTSRPLNPISPSQSPLLPELGEGGGVRAITPHILQLPAVNTGEAPRQTLDGGRLESDAETALHDRAGVQSVKVAQMFV